MESLRKRILEEGRALSKSVLKVDSFFQNLCMKWVHILRNILKNII